MTTTSTTIDELTDAQYEVADKIEKYLEAHAGKDFTRSVVANRVHTDYQTAQTVLAYMAERGYVTSFGAGSWTHYTAR